MRCWSISRSSTAEALSCAERFGGYRGVPSLVLSAVGDERQRVRALDAGACDFVVHRRRR